MHLAGRYQFHKRVLYIEPGKFRPGQGAHFGHRREALHVADRDVEVLIAEPGSLTWVPASGKFTEEHSSRVDAVDGCRENDGTMLAIVRAWAREHLRIFTEKTIQPGKASAKLDCAYVIAGKEEKKVKVEWGFLILMYLDAHRRAHPEL